VGITAEFRKGILPFTVKQMLFVKQAGKKLIMTK
jgi:hypothetical protein|tara:strand:- start:1214 stop:1315 length:102 start_codon:yes stop_codon:yes gene_type:complete